MSVHSVYSSPVVQWWRTHPLMHSETTQVQLSCPIHELKPVILCLMHQECPMNHDCLIMIWRLAPVNRRATTAMTPQGRHGVAIHHLQTNLGCYHHMQSSTISPSPRSLPSPTRIVHKLLRRVQTRPPPTRTVSVPVDCCV